MSNIKTLVSLFNFWNVDFIGRNTLTYCRDQGCDVTQGNSRNSTLADYYWDASSCYRNGVWGVHIDGNQNSNRLIYNSYFTSTNCGPPPGNMNWWPPFDRADVSLLDENSYKTCQARFTQGDFIYPSDTITLYSWTGQASHEPAYSPCYYSSNRWSEQSHINDTSDDFIISPVPAADFITISNLSIGAEILIFDLLGKIVKKNSAVSNALEINISELSSGIYIVKVNSMNPQRFLKLF